MDLDSFLFGNINEEGKLENEDLDDELKKYISQFSAQRENKELIKQILDISDQPDSQEVKRTSVSSSSVQHSSSAIDYSDITEEIEEPSQTVVPPVPEKSFSRPLRDFSNEDLEDIDELFQEQLIPHPPKPESLDTVEEEEFNEDNLLPELRAFMDENRENKNIKFTSLFFSSYPNSIESTSGNLAIGNALKKGKFKRREENSNVDLDTNELFRMNPKEVELKVKPAPKISFKGQAVPSVVGQRPTVAPPSAQAKKQVPVKLSQTQLSWIKWEEGQRRQYVPTEHAYLTKPVSSPETNESFYNFQLVPWDRKAQALISGREEKPLAPYLLQRPYLLPHNWDLEKGNWTESVIYDENELPKIIPPLNLVLNMNDPYLLFDRLGQEDISKRLVKAERIISRKLKRIRKAQKSGISIPMSGSSESIANLSFAAITNNPSQFFSKPFPDKFNLSNDRFYESIKEQKGGIHGSFEKVTLHHSIPALKLQPPHFKCALSKAELRSFHRPKLTFSPGDSIQFSNLKENKKAKKNQEFGEVIKNTRGLTLRDDTPFSLFEFSEELPLLMNCSGMGNLVNIYYRKKSSKDEYFPEPADMGIPVVLDVGEPGPFMGFVDVSPGQELTVLFNNMYRAPLFKHESNSTDFLLVRYTKESYSNYYLRPISNIFVVGQTFPCTEVFGPHSRKLNTYSRNRIQIAAYRYFQKKDNPRKRVKMSTLTTLFPQFSEGTIRKWLKDYAESSRQGKDSGYWIMKSNAPNMAEEELQQLITPEMVCQYESMLAGQQRLIDTGHSAHSLGETEHIGSATQMQESAFGDEDQESILDDELKLAPWNLTNNFLIAAQGKAMLELHGIGDPTGVGEAFSFVKIPLKTQIASRQQMMESPRKQSSSQRNAFYHKATLADQQAAYRKEINQIWEKSRMTLSSTTNPSLSENAEPAAKSSSSLPNLNEIVAQHPEDQFTEESLREAASDPKSVPRQFRGKKLVITRKIKRADGTIETQSDTIYDSRVIEAYTRHMEERKAKLTVLPKLSIITTGHHGKGQDNAKPSTQSTSILITNLNAIPASSGTKKRPLHQSPSLGQVPSHEKVVKCGACGQLGHMRTNKSCPMYLEEAGKASKSADQSQTNKEIADRHPTASSIQESEGQEKKPKKSKSISLRISLPSSSTSSAGQSGGKSPYAKLGRVLEHIVAHLITIPDSWPFHKPVDGNYAPHYFEIITHPIDLSTIRRKCTKGSYSSADDFIRDLRLMHSNCVTYNGPDHPFSKTAAALLHKAIRLVQERANAIEKALQQSHSPPPPPPQSQHQQETAENPPEGEQVNTEPNQQQPQTNPPVSSEHKDNVIDILM